MSLDKAIQSGKEHRKPYHGSGKHDPTCRPNGSCPWCRRNRLHKHRKALEVAMADEKEGGAR